MKFDNAVFECAAGTAQQLIASDLPEVAFAGRSNVGKSSLLNRLLNRKSLARVSAVPGKTVTVNFFRLPSCRFVDLPGYGYAKVSFSEKERWAQLVEGYFTSGRDLRLVVQLIDMRHPMSEQDAQMLAFLRDSGIPCAVALTKCDKLNKTERENMLLTHCEAITKFGAIPVVPFSATKGEGVTELQGIISRALEA
jgi:GTP-binding protein